MRIVTIVRLDMVQGGQSATRRRRRLRFRMPVLHRKLRDRVVLHKILLFLRPAIVSVLEPFGWSKSEHALGISGSIFGVFAWCTEGGLVVPVVGLLNRRTSTAVTATSTECGQETGEKPSEEWFEGWQAGTDNSRVAFDSRPRCGADIVILTWLDIIAQNGLEDSTYR